MTKYNIAIDGVGAAGKGTYAKKLAQALGYKLLDAGAMYRALTVFFQKQNISPDEVAKHLSSVKSMDFDGVYPYVNGKKYTEKDGIRSEEISRITPKYGNNIEFKKVIIKWQKHITSKEKGWVGEGRNIAFDVMEDNADLRIYLNANSMVRALRRWREQNLSDSEFPNVYECLLQRDEDDFNHYPPLIRPESAKNKYDIVFDSTTGNRVQNMIELIDVVRKQLPKVRIIDSKVDEILGQLAA